MRNFHRLAVWSTCLLLAGVVSAADVNDAPLTENWAPSEWGPDDKAGAVNRLTPELVLKHAGLIKTGRFATLGKTYQFDAPFFGTRSFKLTVPGIPTGGPIGEHQLIYNDATVTSEIGQVGTQFDGPGHIGVITSSGNWFYNGRLLTDESVSALGIKDLGVEHVGKKGYVCRGVLLDAAAYRSMDRLPIPKGGDANDAGNINDRDIDGMVKRQGIAPIGEGDCVFLYTGHGNLWDPEKWDDLTSSEKAQRITEFKEGTPGFGASACDYLAERKVVLTGADNWAVESVPGETQANPLACHLQLQTRRGIWALKNLDLSQLVEDKAYEFLFVWAPLKLKGGTGSPANPIAIY